MKKARNGFARAAALGVSLALAASLFPITAFATSGSNTTQEWQEQPRYNVTAPVALIFGSEGNGHDVQDKDANPTVIGTFENNTKIPITIDTVQYLPVRSDTKYAFKGNVEDAITSVKMSNKADIGRTETINPTVPKKFTKEFIVPPSGKTSFDYEIDLEESEIKDTAPDGGETAYPFGKLKYIFNTNATFWFTDYKDPSHPRTYSLEEVKADALKIAAGDESIQARYADYIDRDVRYGYDNSEQGKGSYACGVSWGDGYIYDLRIVGINHDDLTTSYELDDENKTQITKAGLTFQFVYTLNANTRAHSSETNARSWPSWELRNRLNNENYGSGAYGSIYKQAPVSLRNEFVQVKKKYCGTNVSNDYMFIFSMTETFGNPLYSKYGTQTSPAPFTVLPWMYQTGTQYEYYKLLGVTGNTNIGLAYTTHQNGTVDYREIWQRDPFYSQKDGTYPAVQHRVCAQTESLYANRDAPTITLGAVRPAFCL